MNYEISKPKLPEGWFFLNDIQSSNLSRELEIELCTEHELFGCEFTAIAGKHGQDDFLFSVKGASSPFYVVTLTWKKESVPELPWATAFASKEDFLHNWLRIFD